MISNIYVRYCRLIRSFPQQIVTSCISDWGDSSVSDPVKIQNYSQNFCSVQVIYFFLCKNVAQFFRFMCYNCRFLVQGCDSSKRCTHIVLSQTSSILILAKIFHWWLPTNQAVCEFFSLVQKLFRSTSSWNDASIFQLPFRTFPKSRVGRRHVLLERSKTLSVAL